MGFRSPCPLRAPACTLMALRTAHAAALPIDDEARDVDRTGILHLPTLVGPRGADQGNPVLLAGLHQRLGAHVSRVDQVLCRPPLRPSLPRFSTRRQSA